MKWRVNTAGRIAAACVVLAAMTAAFAAGPDERPNIVLIISDDQGWGDYGFMGHDRVRTPHLDRLASQSRIFTRGYVPTSLCRPSLATMITGLQPHQHGITGNDPAPPRDRARRERVIAMLDELPTLPTLLAERGYLSHQSGKWWEGHHRRGGFTHGMTHGDPDRGGRHGDAGLTIGRDGMGPIFDFIEHARAERKPFFVWYAPFLPHTPHNPPRRLLDNYRDEDRPIEVARYYAMIEWFDETCGELLDYLDEHGLADNTLVLYVCDNGWIQMHADMPLPQNWRGEGYAPRSKRSPYDGGIRTPIMVRLPGRIEAVRDQRTPVHTIDLAPTILAAAGLEPTDAMTGLNLLDDEALGARDAIFGAVFEHDMPDPLDEPGAGLRHRWIIRDRWKLIYPRYADGARQDVEIELYDILEDPHERHNLVEEKPGRALQLMRMIDDWWPALAR